MQTQTPRAIGSGFRLDSQRPLARDASSAAGPRILAFPKGGNDYTERLYAEVQARGIAVLQGEWSRSWLARNVRPGDVIHIHWLSFLYVHARSSARTTARLAKLYTLLRFAKARGARIVWTAHNLYPHDGGRARANHRIGRKIITSLADYVCVHGESAAAIVTRELHVPESRLRIAHHGHWLGHYPNEMTRAESRTRLDVGNEPFVYLFVGRCRPYKGLEDLIDAFIAAPRPAKLIIAGKFSSQEYLEEIRSRIGGQSDIELVARSIADDELQLYLNAADCVVLPYRAVLTSGTAMLALSFGRPVVAPDLGALRDHVNSRCGVLYSPDEATGLAAALREVRARRFNSGVILQHARRFSWEQLAAPLLDILHEPRTQ